MLHKRAIQKELWDGIEELEEELEAACMLKCALFVVL